MFRRKIALTGSCCFALQCVQVALEVLCKSRMRPVEVLIDPEKAPPNSKMFIVSGTWFNVEERQEVKVWIRVLFPVSFWDEDSLNPTCCGAMIDGSGIFNFSWEKKWVDGKKRLVATVDELESSIPPRAGHGYAPNEWWEIPRLVRA